jgi:hypothetical protein
MKTGANYISFHVGLDLGKEADFSAVAILEKITPIDRKNRVCGETEFNVLGLKRFPLKTPYPDIVREVVGRLKKEPFSAFIDMRGNEREHKTPVFLTIDETGVGKPVFDLFKEDGFLQKRVTLQGITITGGKNVSDSDSGYNVPKRDLILSLQVELQKGNLRIARSMPEAENLVSELQNFEVKFTVKANDTYNAKSGLHDDLVLACSLALWSARNSNNWFDGGEMLRRALMPWRSRRMSA